MRKLEELTKTAAARLSITFNVAQTVAKLAGALLTGSVSLLSEALHSGTDILASGMAYAAVRIGSEPPDEDHPYGHGKVESLAGFAESVLLVVTVAYILYNSITKLQTPHHPEHLEIGMYLLAACAAGGAVVANLVRKASKDSRSLALKSNSQHLMTDVWTTVGVFCALAVTHFTKWQQADPIFGIGFALWIGYGAVGIAREAVEQLVDRSLTAAELAEIEKIIKSDPQILGFHRLRSRQSGELRYVDVHIVVPNELTLIQAHDIANNLEKNVERDLAPAQCVVHVDPYDATKGTANLPDLS